MIGVRSNEVRAVYYNNADLKFGRDMHCLEKNFYENFGGLFVAYRVQVCYVTNFTNNTALPLPGSDAQTGIDLAISDLWPVATVAMTAVESTLFLFNPAPTPSVAFIVFAPQSQNLGNAGPNAADQFVPSRAAVLDRTDSNPNNGKPKAVPGVCMACHGGSYTTTVDDARFLPFDTHTFLYDTSGETFFTEAGQGEAFRKLNSIVLDADVSSSTPITSTAISDMIAGWYQWCGGVTTPHCAIDDVNHLFVPGAPPPAPGSLPIECSSAPNQPVTCGWADNFYKEILYQAFPRAVCRGCHLANANQFNWQNYTNAIGSGTTICGALSSNMPFAQVPFNNLWNSAFIRTLADEGFNCTLPKQ